MVFSQEKFDNLQNIICQKLNKQSYNNTDEISFHLTEIGLEVDCLNSLFSSINDDTQEDICEEIINILLHWSYHIVELEKCTLLSESDNSSKKM